MRLIVAYACVAQIGAGEAHIFQQIIRQFLKFAVLSLMFPVPCDLAKKMAKPAAKTANRPVEANDIVTEHWNLP